MCVGDPRAAASQLSSSALTDREEGASLDGDEAEDPAMSLLAFCLSA